MIEFLIFALVLGGGVLIFPKTVGASIAPVGNLLTPPERSTTFDNADLEALARTVWGEARNEGYAGMQAVANVVMNRYAAAQASVAKGQQFGFTIEQICKKPYQFSVWNAGDPNYSKILAVTAADGTYQTALDIASRALSGTLEDITGGADHYLNIDLTRQSRGGTLPSWVDISKQTANIGSHTFLRLA